MILIYLPDITSRAQYVFGVIFRDLLKTGFSVTRSMDEFQSYQGPRINYSTKNVEGVIRITPDKLLFNKETINYPAGVAHHSNIPVLFPRQEASSDLPFDPFAAAFYMVTRFEEYSSFRGDRYGRYRPEESVARKGKFLRKPVVNLWAEMLRDLLLDKYPRLTFGEKKFRFVPTIDIDHAFAFGHRGFSRNIGGITRDIGNLDFRNLLLRLKVMFGKAKDPYDTYDLLRHIHEKHGVKPIWFILFADYGRNDNNVSLKNKRFRKLIKEISRQDEMGIHPSLSSNRDPSLLRREINRMAHVIDRRVVNSRQHFLKFSFPKTFRSLMKNEIQHEYSMGYASEPGFRAGIADPFMFYDLSADEETDLMIHPVTLMDVSMKDYLRLEPEEALGLIRELTDTVRSVNGEFVSLWHNESLSDINRWRGWRRVYEELVSYAAGR